MARGSRGKRNAETVNIRICFECGVESRGGGKFGKVLYKPKGDVNPFVPYHNENLVFLRLFRYHN
jgi:hypothetical protein